MRGRQLSGCEEVKRVTARQSVVRVCGGCWRHTVKMDADQKEEIKKRSGVVPDLVIDITDIRRQKSTPDTSTSTRG